jgi:hypothetical protein
MLRLVFMVCLIDAPEICEQREMLVHEEMPVIACVMGAMPELATWRQTHPNWRIARWRCEDDRTVRRSAPDDDHARRLPVVAGSEATRPGPVAVATSRGTSLGASR